MQNQSRSQGFVVSLSGGADSSAVAVLIFLLAQFGGRELGFDKLAQKLSHIKSLADMKSLGEAYLDLVRKLLTCVYQSTRNSGEQTPGVVKVAPMIIGAMLTTPIVVR